MELPTEEAVDADLLPVARTIEDQSEKRVLELVESAHPDLGKLGVFWHTQGSGKSYSMAFFAEKVRRRDFGQVHLLADDRPQRSGQPDLPDVRRLRRGRREDAARQFRRGAEGFAEARITAIIFSLIHKFNQDVNPHEPYSTRDDIIVISDEAHRTQAGKLARNMRLALPNAAFIGFTGTPLFKHDNLTKRIFGTYVSRYDFKRSEEDGATVKLVYENRGEKLGIARLDLNDRIADAIAQGRTRPGQGGAAGKAAGAGLRGHHRR